MKKIAAILEKGITRDNRQWRALKRIQKYSVGETGAYFCIFKGQVNPRLVIKPITKGKFETTPYEMLREIAYEEVMGAKIFKALGLTTAVPILIMPQSPELETLVSVLEGLSGEKERCLKAQLLCCKANNLPVMVMDCIDHTRLGEMHTKKLDALFQSEETWQKLGGVVAVDALIGNGDRIEHIFQPNPGNLLILERTKESLEQEVICIDQGILALRERFPYLSQAVLHAKFQQLVNIFMGLDRTVSKEEVSREVQVEMEARYGKEACALHKADIEEFNAFDEHQTKESILESLYHQMRRLPDCGWGFQIEGAKKERIKKSLEVGIIQMLRNISYMTEMEIDNAWKQLIGREAIGQQGIKFVKENLRYCLYIEPESLSSPYIRSIPTPVPILDIRRLIQKGTRDDYVVVKEAIEELGVSEEIKEQLRDYIEKCIKGEGAEQAKKDFLALLVIRSSPFRI